MTMRVRALARQSWSVVRPWFSPTSPTPAWIDLKRLPHLTDVRAFRSGAAEDRFYAVAYLQHRVEVEAPGNFRTLSAACVGWLVAVTVAVLGFAWTTSIDTKTSLDLARTSGGFAIAAVAVLTSLLVSTLAIARRSDHRRAYARAWLDAFAPGGANRDAG